MGTSCSAVCAVTVSRIRLSRPAIKVHAVVHAVMLAIRASRHCIRCSPVVPSRCMAGHSKFKKIKHAKGANDAKRSNQFAKMSLALSVAARGTPPFPLTPLSHPTAGHRQPGSRVQPGLDQRDPSRPSHQRATVAYPRACSPRRHCYTLPRHHKTTLTAHRCRCRKATSKTR